MYVPPELTWTLSAVVLFWVAAHKFNQPPTQRAGTTFLRFYLGTTLYYIFVLALWATAIVLLEGGLIPLFGKVGVELEAKHPLTPLIAMAAVVLGYASRRIRNADAQARKLCSELAAIPREKEALALKIREYADFDVQDERLQHAVLEEAERRQVDGRSLNFGDAFPFEAVLWTKALTIYCALFAPPFSRQYTAFMIRHSKEAEGAKAKFDDLTKFAKGYFVLENVSEDLKIQFVDKLQENLAELSQILSGAVLANEKTRGGRLRRLQNLGFRVDMTPQPLTKDHLVAVALAAAIFFTMVFMLGSGRNFEAATTGAFPIGVEIAIAVAVGIQAAVWNEKRAATSELPPLAMWLVAALLSGCLAGLLRLAIFAAGYLDQNLLNAAYHGWIELTADRRWAWRVMTPAITLGLIVSCTRKVREPGSPREWTLDGVIVMGFVVGGAAIVKTLRGDRGPEPELLFPVLALLGFSIGAIFPFLYRRSGGQQLEGAPSGQIAAGLAEDPSPRWEPDAEPPDSPTRQDEKDALPRSPGPHPAQRKARSRRRPNRRSSNH